MKLHREGADKSKIATGDLVVREGVLYRAIVTPSEHLNGGKKDPPLLGNIALVRIAELQRGVERGIRISLHAALEHAASLARQDQLRPALDEALSAIDDALVAQQFEIVDDAVRAFDFEGSNLDLAVTVLLTCKPARENLPSRAKAVERLRVRMYAELPKRAEEILRFLR